MQTNVTWLYARLRARWATNSDQLENSHRSSSRACLHSLPLRCRSSTKAKWYSRIALSEAVSEFWSFLFFRFIYGCIMRSTDFYFGRLMFLSSGYCNEWCTQCASSFDCCKFQSSGTSRLLRNEWIYRIASLIVWLSAIFGRVDY